MNAVAVFFLTRLFQVVWFDTANIRWLFGQQDLHELTETVLELSTSL